MDMVTSESSGVLGTSHSPVSAGKSLGTLGLSVEMERAFGVPG